MKRIILITILVICIQLVRAQSITKIESHGSNIVLTVWSGGENPSATVLAVPGWGGGPTDVLGIGEALSSKSITVLVLTPRGWHNSEGIASFTNALDDIEAALAWIKDSKRLDINTTEIILGGHSWGGGMSLAYAAKDTSVNRIFSIAGTDHGIIIRKYIASEEYAEMLDKILASTSAPDGPIKFNVEESLSELKENQNIYGLIENAKNLADRSIIIFGGWQDRRTTIDDFLLPLYRALEAAGAKDVIFKTYHDNHGFRTVREELYSDLLMWIER
jgi:pimeloyl-ACP methyl ester carboxylesterase